MKKSKIEDDYRKTCFNIKHKCSIPNNYSNRPSIKINNNFLETSDSTNL